MRVTKEPITRQRLDQLAVLPRFNWRDSFTVEGELSAEDVAAMDSYFEKFVRMEDGKCINCGTVQGGLMSALLGGFEYDITHGEGHCSKCGYPARANHYDVGPIKRWNVILQYHPSALKLRGEETVEELA